jgi:hypothetical protein
MRTDATVARGRRKQFHSLVSATPPLIRPVDREILLEQIGAIGYWWALHAGFQTIGLHHRMIRLRLTRSPYSTRSS